MENGLEVITLKLRVYMDFIQFLQKILKDWIQMFQQDGHDNPAWKYLIVKNY